MHKKIKSYYLRSNQTFTEQGVFYFFNLYKFCGYNVLICNTSHEIGIHIIEI